MKLYAKKIHVVLGLAILTQVGCNGGKGLGNQQGYLYPNVATQQQDHSAMGDAFRTTQTGLNSGANPTGWNNVLNTVARGVAPTGTIPAGDGTTTTTTPAGKKGDGIGAGDGGDDSESFTIKMNTESAAKVECKKQGIATDRKSKDTDGDGISDDCEDALAKSDLPQFMGLDSKIFNGAVVVAKRFYKEPAGIFGNKTTTTPDNSILLSSEELKSWKKAKKLGGFGDGVDSKFDRQITRKFLARATMGGNDMRGLKALMGLEQQNKDEKEFEPYIAAFHDNQIGHRGIDNGLKGVPLMMRDGSAKTKDGVAMTTDTASQYALVRNDYFESIPFALNKDGMSVGFLSGMQKDVNSLRQNQEFLYVAETHIVVPEGGLELRVGRLIQDRTKAVAGSRAGMFFVIHDNNTDIVTTDLIQSKLTDSELQASMGTIVAPSNCITAHFAIAYLADSKTVADGISKAIFAENVFYHDVKEDVWKPIPQEWLRLKAMDMSADQTCKVDKEDIIFSDLKDKLSLATVAP